MSDSEIEEEVQLEGFTTDDGQMYLRDENALVYSCLRDDDGGLVRVGQIDKHGKLELDGVEAKETPSANPRSADSSAETEPQVRSSVRYAFEVEEADHCETPLQAFADIALWLEELATRLGKSKAELVIYDPYYCAGGTARRLANLGFSSCINENVDFYSHPRCESDYDVLVTNPPYSADHVPRLLSHCTRQGAKPWFLLLPNWVCTKPYYGTLARPSRQWNPFYVVPHRRYRYESPIGARAVGTERRTAPFPSFWYCAVGAEHHRALMDTYLLKTMRGSGGSRECVLCRGLHDIPDKARDSNDPLHKKARDRERRAKRKEKQAQRDASVASSSSKRPKHSMHTGGSSESRGTKSHKPRPKKRKHETKPKKRR